MGNENSLCLFSYTVDWGCLGKLVKSCSYNILIVTRPDSFMSLLPFYAEEAISKRARIQTRVRIEVCWIFLHFLLILNIHGVELLKP